MSSFTAQPLSANEVVPDAFHVDVDGEFPTVPVLSELTDNDFILIEDSEDGFKKKRMRTDLLSAGIPVDQPLLIFNVDVGLVTERTVATYWDEQRGKRFDIDAIHYRMLRGGGGITTLFNNGFDGTTIVPFDTTVTAISLIARNHSAIGEDVAIELFDAATLTSLGVSDPLYTTAVTAYPRGAVFGLDIDIPGGTWLTARVTAGGSLSSAKAHIITHRRYTYPP